MSTPSPFKVTIKLVESDKAIRAKADVEGKTLTIRGFSVFEGKKSLWVSMPSLKNGNAYTDVIEFHSKAVKESVCKAVLEAYQTALSNQGQASTDDQGAGF